jgi:hypothetical protein
MEFLTRKEKLFHLAYELAFFMHGQKDVAIQIAIQAMLTLDINDSKQEKRFYYRPLTFRAKVYLKDAHSLQHFVYIESEPHERRQENSDAVTQLEEEDMLIRFVAYLTRITLVHNSFYVALGLCRFVYNYGLAETRDLYEVVIQDEKRHKEDDSYRKGKRRLKGKLYGRFGNFLRIAKGLRGEEHFEIERSPERHTQVLLDCLKEFTPWRTKCALPAHFNPVAGAVPSLFFKGNNPDGDHPIEINRIHSLLHPPCLSRLVGSLHFDAPEKRLALPHFMLSKDNAGGGSKKNRHHPPRLEKADLAEFEHALAAQASLRRNYSLGMLSIKVDGIERARLDVRTEKHVRLEIEEGVEAIEVDGIDRGRELPLANCLLSFDELHRNGGTIISSVSLEGGQRLKFTTSLLNQPDDEDARALVYITCEESPVQRATAIILDREKRILDLCSQLALRQVAILMCIISISVTIAFSSHQISFGSQAQAHGADTPRNEQEKDAIRVAATDWDIEVERRAWKRNPYDANINERVSYKVLQEQKFRRASLQL